MNTATLELRKTAWCVIGDDGSYYTDEAGHIWFTKPLAMALGRAHGVIPRSISSGGLKQTVTGYKEAGNAEA